MHRLFFGSFIHWNNRRKNALDIIPVNQDIENKFYGWFKNCQFCFQSDAAENEDWKATGYFHCKIFIKKKIQIRCTA